jgi:hypothetical protein
MEATLHGPADAPGIALLSTWDPYLPGYDLGLQRLVASAVDRQLTPVAVLLDPPPAVFINAPGEWPVFSDAQARIAWLRARGASVVSVTFTRDDLAFAADEFFDLVTSLVPLQEFWLKHRQTVGSGPRGSGVGTRLSAVRRGIRVVSLPPDDLGADAFSVRQLLRAGAVGKAADLVGRAPVFARPRTGRVRMAWLEGTYQMSPCGSARPQRPLRTPLDVECQRAGDGEVEWQWPDARIPYLTVLWGPGDEQGRAVSRPAGHLA